MRLRLPYVMRMLDILINVLHKQAQGLPYDWLITR
jgi:hypothetical protein